MRQNISNENSSWIDDNEISRNISCEEVSSVFYTTASGITLAVPLWEALVTGIILGIITLITIIGNVLVILSVFNYRPLRIAQNFFIVSLAVADLTVAVLVLPLNAAYYLIGKWVLGISICKMWLTSDVLCCTASILNLCAIALDRYWAITDPINYASKRTLKRVIVMIAITWVLSAIISSPPLIGWNDWPDEFDDNTPCQLTTEKGYVVYSAAGSFFIPLIIMGIVYMKIFMATRRRLRERARACKLNAVRDKLTDKKEQSSPMDPESISSDLTTNCVDTNSCRSKAKVRKSKKRCKRKAKCSQHSLLVPRTQADESLSDVPSISPGKGTSSEGNEVSGEGNNNPEKVAVEEVLHKESAYQKETSFIVKSTNAPKKSVFVHQFIEERQRISLSKERKAARTLGIIVGVFVFCWLPFFAMYVTLPFCSKCCLSRKAMTFITWLGYINSALNPIIYTIFNIDFRKAFKKLLRLKQVS